MFIRNLLRPINVQSEQSRLRIGIQAVLCRFQKHCLNEVLSLVLFNEKNSK